jgi:anti-sigma factor RsiW
MNTLFLDHDLLLAYVDGQLPAERVTAVEAALMYDAEAWETVRLLRLSSNAAMRAFAPVLEEPVPAHLIAATGTRPAASRSSRQLRWPLAMAASLVALAIGVAGGYVLRGVAGGYVPTSLPASVPTGDPLTGRFEAALTAILETGGEGASASYESPAEGRGRIVLGHGFVTGFGRSCREFHQDETRGSTHHQADGLACRAADHSWSVMMLPAAG